MAGMTVIIETIWTSAPEADQRLYPNSPLAREVLGVGPTPVACCVGPLTLDNVFVFGLRPVYNAPPTLFDRVHALAVGE